MDKEKEQVELHYRLSKWIVIDLIKTASYGNRDHSDPAKTDGEA